MIYTDKNKKGIIIQCDCGAEALEIDNCNVSKNEKEYYISILMQTWYTKQNSFIDRLKEKLKMIWCILKGRDYILTELCLSENDFKDLKEIIKDYE